MTTQPTIVVNGQTFNIQNAAQPWSFAEETVLRFEVRPGDHWAGDPRPLASRSEISGWTQYPNSSKISMAYQMLVEAGDPALAGPHCVIGQLHPNDSAAPTPPKFFVALDGDYLKIFSGSQDATGNQTFATLWADPNPLVRGKWYAFSHLIHFDAVNGSIVSAVDGAPAANYSGPLIDGSEVSVYPKLGIYRYDPNPNILATNFKNILITAV